MYRNLVLFLGLIFCSSLFSQNKKYLIPEYRCSDIKGESIIRTGIDSEFFIAINDTVWISMPDKKKLHIPKDELGDEFISDFNHIYLTNEGTYFVHSGGGVVLFYDGLSLKRVDDSFYHQNQYGGKSFVYQNELYLFGGQGLFTAKNILTRYDKDLNEWISVTQNGKIPKFNRNAIVTKIGNELYLLKRQSLQDKNLIKPMLIYRLELSTMTWNLAGQTSPQLTSEFGYKFKKVLVDPVTNKLVLKTDNGTFIIDFINNEFQRLNLDYPFDRSNIFNFEKDQSFIGFYCDNKTQLQNIVISREDFFSKADAPKEFYKINLDLYYSVLVQILGVILISIIMVVLIREIKLDPRIVIRLRNASFIYGLSRLKCFDKKEVSFFMHIAEHERISFRDLEDLISQSKDSTVTRTKNRERFFRLLNAKLQAVFNFELNENNEWIIVNSNPHDKRSKYYELNPKYFNFL